MSVIKQFSNNEKANLPVTPSLLVAAVKWF